MTCACHWTVNVAASRGYTKLYADAYSVAPAAIFVPANSPIRTPAEVAGVPISVGYQSGSHYSTIQALEQYLPADQIELSFEEGMLFGRLELFVAGKSPAVALFNGPYYLAEQLGCRKIIDSTFMIGAIINGNPEPDDVRKYFRALRRAQRDIDLRPDLYTHYYRMNFPSVFTLGWTRGAGDPASELFSRHTARRCLNGHSTGLRSARSLSPVEWAPATTNRR